MREFYRDMRDRLQWSPTNQFEIMLSLIGNFSEPNLAAETLRTALAERPLQESLMLLENLIESHVPRSGMRLLQLLDVAPEKPRLEAAEFFAHNMTQRILAAMQPWTPLVREAEGGGLQMILQLNAHTLQWLQSQQQSEEVGDGSLLQGWTWIYSFAGETLQFGVGLFSGTYGPWIDCFAVSRKDDPRTFSARPTRKVGTFELHSENSRWLVTIPDA